MKNNLKVKVYKNSITYHLDEISITSNTNELKSLKVKEYAFGDGLFGVDIRAKISTKSDCRHLIELLKNHLTSFVLK